MAEIYMDVDTAVIVPVNVLPLLDDTDFKSIETAVVYNSAGLVVTWNFVTSTGVQTGVAITPTIGGVYDWSEPIADKGMYAIEIPASGGVSANNDTEGYGWISGVATGVLPWRGPIIGFRAAALNDALCDGGDNLDVNTVQWLGTACATPTVAGVPEVDLTHVAGATTNVSALATNVDAILTDTGTTGVVNALIERNYIENGTAQSGTANTIVLAAGASSTNDLWVGQQVSIYDGTGAGQTRGVLNYNGATKSLTVARNWKVNPDATSKYKIQLQFGPKVNNTLEVSVADAGADLTAIPWNSAWDTEVQSECVDALTAYGASTHSAADTWAVATRVLTAGTNIVLVKGTGVTGFNDLSAAQVNTEADTALTDYGASTPTDVLTQVNAALDAAGTELTAIPTTTGTIRQKLNFVFQYFRNKKTVTSTTETLKKEDASTTLGTATVSDDGSVFTKGEMN